MAVILFLKCRLVLCVFFVLCRYRSHQAELDNIKLNHEDSEDDDDDKVLNEIDTLDKNILSGWNNLKTSEPGFDLTEKETEKFKIWQNGIIPYYIDDLSFDTTLRMNIRLFLESVNAETSIRFSELTRPPSDEQTRYVFFINRRGILECPDYNTKNFTIYGVQRVILGYDCFISGKDFGSVVLAILGVPPQHNAPNRDQFIAIQKENILPDKIYLFETLSNDEWLFQDVGYDYNSVGHYDLYKYTKNGRASFKVLKNVPNGFYVGESTGFTYTDVWKISMLYNYIVRKNKSTKFDECQKLYKRGSQIDKFEPKSDDEVPPRSRFKLYGDKKIEQKQVTNKQKKMQMGPRTKPTTTKTSRARHSLLE